MRCRVCAVSLSIASTKMRLIYGVLVVLAILAASSAGDFEDHFKDCHPNVPGFDACIREALNAIRPYFKTGLSTYNVAPFDPFFAREVSVKRGMQNFGFTLTLRNVTESGWAASKVTKFVSDLPNHKVTVVLLLLVGSVQTVALGGYFVAPVVKRFTMSVYMYNSNFHLDASVVYTQSFPEKFLSGSYEFNANVIGSSVANKGKFTLALYDLVQTTTINRRPGQKIQVNVDVQTIRDLKLHVTNLLSGHQILETVLDKIINGTWQPGFVITRRLINELVSSAFTEIFGTAFRQFPFDKIIKPKPSES